jgi:hypothetical protein
VGDRKFTLEEVDRAAMQANMQAYQQLYDARRQALEGLIETELLARAAAAKGVSVDELVAAEVTAATAPVTDDDVSAFYNQNQPRMGGRTLEQVAPQIRDYLQAMHGNQARQNYLDGLRAATAVDVTLEPPRVEMKVAANDPAKGPATAAVTVIEYSDFQ